MSKFLSALQPATLDAALAGKTNLLARLWQLTRITLLDRGVYWGVLITLVLPAAFWLFGGFAFHGSLLAAVTVSAAFWLYTVVASLLIGVTSLVVLGRENKKRVTRTQMVGFMVSTGAFLWGLGAYFPELFSVSLFGIVVGVLVITLTAEWAMPEGGCSGGSCDLPKK